MLIQKCINCSNSFKWSTIIKAIWSWGGFKPIKCESCKTTHLIKPIYRIIIIVLALIPLLFENHVFELFKALGLNAYIFWAYPAWMILLILLSPFFIRFYVKE
ncbi:TIGR04104 family putative zinc finger protein [Clostridium sp. YIM B02551]|uniref:TIGR04104 family putative zinc finger protein n=1 Tax=Clostridium sp. YIM B02551 TaxID=2910679 RepID=UPI0035A09928